MSSNCCALSCQASQMTDLKWFGWRLVAVMSLLPISKFLKPKVTSLKWPSSSMGVSATPCTNCSQSEKETGMSSFSASSSSESSPSSSSERRTGNKTSLRSASPSCLQVRANWWSPPVGKTRFQYSSISPQKVVTSKPRRLSETNLASWTSSRTQSVLKFIDLLLGKEWHLMVLARGPHDPSGSQVRLLSQLPSSK